MRIKKLARIVSLLSLSLSLSLTAVPGDSHADATAAAWKVAIEDDFSGRAAGSPLAGSAPSISAAAPAAAWRAQGNDAVFVVSETGAVASGNAQGGKTFCFLDCVPENAGKIRLETELRPGGAQWLAAGFGGAAGFLWDSGVLWVAINGSRGGEGAAVVYSGGTKTALASAKPADYGFDSKKPTRVELILDTAANTASVSLNGKAILEARPLDASVASAMRRAGLMMNFPAPNDPALSADNFRVSVSHGATLAKPGAAAPAKARVAESARRLVALEASAAKRTNLLFGGKDLRVEIPLAQTAPYFAEFDFALAEKDAGEFDAWALLLASNAAHISPWKWRLDRGADTEGKALEGSLGGAPRWVKFAKNLALSEGAHTLRFEVAGRRGFPDDSYMFLLWKVFLAPSEAGFVPNEANPALGFNPQANQSAAGAGAAAAATDANSDAAPATAANPSAPVTIVVDAAAELPPVQPIWRDLSEGGVETGGDFLDARLAAPLRPRYFRKCHILSLGKTTRGADGALRHDFAEPIKAVRSILASGATPIIDLANVPAEIRKGVPIGDWAANERFRAEWTSTVTAFLQALADAGLGARARWFTCFNEPEFSHMGTVGHDAASLAIFDAAARAVKAFDPDLVMCGMEFGNARSSIFNAFLDYCAGNPGLVDVFAFHQYNSTPARMAHEIRSLRQELDKRGLQKMKIAVNEWGVSSAGHPAIRAGMDAAAYNASCIKAMAEAGLDIGGLFCFKDYPNDGWKWGLTTEDGFLKPSYWGQWLWAQLPDDGARLRVSGGDERVQAFALRGADGAVSILLWHDAPANFPLREVTLALQNWSGGALSEWKLDATRHIGFIPAPARIELPSFERQLPTGAGVDVKFQLAPQSMRLLRITPSTGDL